MVMTTRAKITDCPRDLQGKAPGTSVKMDHQFSKFLLGQRKENWYPKRSYQIRYDKRYIYNNLISHDKRYIYNNLISHPSNVLSAFNNLISPPNSLTGYVLSAVTGNQNDTKSPANPHDDQQLSDWCAQCSHRQLSQLHSHGQHITGAATGTQHSQESTSEGNFSQ